MDATGTIVMDNCPSQVSPHASPLSIVAGCFLGDQRQKYILLNSDAKCQNSVKKTSGLSLACSFRLMNCL
ncbi:hypothetical protein E2C01_090066 [Portunus trituberculatus]|uniref:Uncharacterized protein n=1 Tax=Portunus trituberculatus TaxID=210409 RepID=A0A5B7JP39_PORTR|nr:hypothetical protein [Portunus trituberculatus]